MALGLSYFNWFSIFFYYQKEK